MGNEIKGCPYGVCNNFEKLGFAMIGERDTRLEMELTAREQGFEKGAQSA